MNAMMRSDAAVYADSLVLAAEIESLGFDSLWTVEHHFTGHSPVPNAIQMLTYWAGRTSRLLLGTAVVVLPWHHPVRVAEEIAVLHNLSNGRAMIGFGRGTSATEFLGFGIPIEESRARFIEAVRIVKLGLEGKPFSFRGEFFTIPELEIRPHIFSSPVVPMLGAANSEESFRVMADLGLGLMISPPKDLSSVKHGIALHRAMCEKNGKEVSATACHLYVSVHPDSKVAHMRASRYIQPMILALDRHHKLFKEQSVPAEGARGDFIPLGTDWWTASDYAGAARTFADRCIVGCPEECLVKLKTLEAELNLGHFIGEFSYGDMPLALSRENLHIFAKKVLPNLR